MHVLIAVFIALVVALRTHSNANFSSRSCFVTTVRFRFIVVQQSLLRLHNTHLDSDFLKYR